MISGIAKFIEEESHVVHKNNTMDIQNKIIKENEFIFQSFCKYADYLKYEKKLNLTDAKEVFNKKINNIIEITNIGSEALVRKSNKYLLKLYMPIPKFRSEIKKTLNIGNEEYDHCLNRFKVCFNSNFETSFIDKF